LTDLQLGPVMLKGRVAALGGSLHLASNRAGARLDIRLPLRPPARSCAEPTHARHRAVPRPL
jgi:glucose-6-phosphate-specific signal transduction histidine kinase